jgi:hypothetical protein
MRGMTESFGRNPGAEVEPEQAGTPPSPRDAGGDGPTSGADQTSGSGQTSGAGQTSRTDHDAGADERDDTLGPLARSARGWHSIQMAVLGFIGICGVLHTANTSVPGWLQWVAALLAVAALAIAGTGIYLVGQVAYPLDGSGGPSSPSTVGRARARLRTGIRLTVLALILIVIAALSGWWPRSSDAGTGSATVTVSDRSGRTWCGHLVAGDTGVVAVDTPHGVIGVPVEIIADVRPVASCP